MKIHQRPVDILVINFIKENRKDLSDFWARKSTIGCLDETGIILNLLFNEQKREIILKIYYN